MERHADPSNRPRPAIRIATVLLLLLMTAATVAVARLALTSPRVTALAVDSRAGVLRPRGILHRLPPLPGASSRTPSSTTTPTTAPPAPTTMVPAPAAPAPPAAPAARPSPGYGCAAALGYLAAHAAPGFTFECPGNALGRQAMTCENVAGVCPGARLIAIADPCPAAYMNEAYNSRVAEGLAPGPYDPYGYCRN